MRIGVSWPGAHRRRYWVSMGPAGWLLTGWVIVPLWLATWALVILVWLLLMGARGIARLAHQDHQ